MKYKKHTKYLINISNISNILNIHSIFDKFNLSHLVPIFFYKIYNQGLYLKYIKCKNSKLLNWQSY